MHIERERSAWERIKLMEDDSMLILIAGGLILFVIGLCLFFLTSMKQINVAGVIVAIIGVTIGLYGASALEQEERSIYEHYEENGIVVVDIKRKKLHKYLVHLGNGTYHMVKMTDSGMEIIGEDVESNNGETD